jgi:hypothetical protein
MKHEDIQTDRQDVIIKEDGIDGTYSTHGRDEK